LLKEGKLVGGGNRGAAGEAVHFLFERGNVFKLAVNAGEAEISYMVEIFQFGHNKVADMSAGHLSAACLVKLPLNFIDELIHSAIGEGSFIAGFADAGEKFFAVELLAASVLLNDKEAGALESLVGGETQITPQALAPSADAVVNITRVDYL
jgi:hypothetical protein